VRGRFGRPGGKTTNLRTSGVRCIVSLQSELESGQKKRDKNYSVLGMLQDQLEEPSGAVILAEVPGYKNGHVHRVHGKRETGGRARARLGACLEGSGSEKGRATHLGTGWRERVGQKQCLLKVWPIACICLFLSLPPTTSKHNGGQC
jgi:hypothetical protein